MQRNDTERQAGHAFAIVIVLLVLVGVGLIGWRVAHRRGTAQTGSGQTAVSTSSGASGGAANDGLNTDLQDVNNAMTQEKSDNAAANSGLNDSQSQITVPTE